tara:strand:- start:54 stop:323 length:270 start_codon:yes stop_codon:yes gene_type:complete
MAKYEIELTDTEDKAMTYVVDGTLDWISHAAKNRARKAKDEIIALNIAHCNANGVTIATGEDAQVTQAFDLKVVKTAKERNDEASKKPE